VLAGAVFADYNLSQPAPQRAFAMNHMRRVTWSWVTCLLLAAATATAQKPDRDRDADARRPKVKLKAQPVVSMSPARVVLTAELEGGADDYEEFYCPSVEWDWGDGTHSESTLDCAPYEPGKSEIKRRFTVEHVFRAGVYKVMFRLKRHDRALAAATVNIQVRQGVRDFGYEITEITEGKVSTQRKGSNGGAPEKSVLQLSARRT
jgi:hypothetical protein